MPAPESPVRVGVVPAVLALVLLAGCGGDAPAADAAPRAADAHVERVVTGPVHSGEAGAGEATGNPALPAYLPTYPGAEVVARINGHKEGTAPGEGGSAVLILRSTDAPGKIMRFYDERARAAGVTPAMQIDEEGDSVRMYADSRLGQGALLAVTRADDGNGSEIVISVGGGEVPVATNTPPQPRDSKLTAFADIRLQ